MRARLGVVLVLVAACGDDAALDSTATPADRDTRDPPSDTDAPPSDPPIGEPGSFDASEYDVETIIDTTKERRRISPLIYGVNSFNVGSLPADLLASVSFVRRGGDRANTYNWETNLSTSSTEQSTQDSDYTLVEHLPLSDRATPAALDVDMITRTRAAGIGAMIPFVLNDYVATVQAYDLPWRSWTAAAGQRDSFFDRLAPVKPSALSATPNLDDGIVYSDEHFAFLKTKLGNIYDAGPTQVLVGIDNEPDLYADNYPYLQAGSGANLLGPSGNIVGKVVDGLQFTNEKFLPFTKRVKELAPGAKIVGPSHYHYDGYTTWEEKMPQFDDRNWFMETFLDLVKTESERIGKRLLDVWDMHWYPQGTIDGQLVEYVPPTTAARVDAIVQSPRAYWDHDYDEGSWVSQHTGGPTYILERIQTRLAAHYPGTPVGVSEYFPGGCGHIASGIGVADSLGIFMRMSVGLAALWPDCAAAGQLTYAYGALKLLRNADGRGLRFADTVVPVKHPDTDKALTSVYAGSDDKTRMTVLVVNKKPSPRTIALRAYHSAALKTVRAYRIDAASPNPTLAGEASLTKLNAYLYAAPPLSATMLVFSQ
jgi:hypothetical protein